MTDWAKMVAWTAGFAISYIVWAVVAVAVIQ